MLGRDLHLVKLSAKVVTLTLTLLSLVVSSVVVVVNVQHFRSTYCPSRNTDRHHSTFQQLYYDYITMKLKKLKSTEKKLMCAVMPVSANGLGILLGFTRF